MSKALVIKGASFLANRVEQITLSQSIPCTGISLSAEQAAISAVGSTYQLIATLEPADTTDSLTWVSSDPVIASVSDNGVVTSVGIGAVTITASCGTQSATCIVSCTESYYVNDKYSTLPGARYSGSINLNANPVKNHVGIASVANAETFYSSENLLNGYKAFVSTTWTETAGLYPIPIPTGATAMTITVPTTVVAGNYRIRMAFENANEQQTFVGGLENVAALGIGAAEQMTAGGTAPLVINLSDYPGANSYILSVTDNGGTTPDNIGNVNVAFSYGTP